MTANTVKKRLLEKSLKVFAAYGYDGTTTRMIANAANANIASISYYYGGKEGLYKCALEHIASEIAAINDPIHRIASSSLDFANKDAAKHILNMLVSAIVESSLKEDMEIFTMILAKELTKPSAYFNIVFEQVTSKTLSLIKKCIAILSPNLTEKEALLLAQNLMSCGMILRTHKHNILKLLDQTSLDSNIIENQKNILKSMVNAICEDV